MRRIALVITVLLVAIVSATSWRACNRPSEQSSSPWVMGYYVGYLKDVYPLDAVNWDALTHVVIGAAVPRADGSVDTTFFLDNVEGPIWARSVVERAHTHDRRAVLMLGGADTRDLFASAASAVYRERFVREISRLVDDYGFDGVDIDWEPLHASDGPDLFALAQELKLKRTSLELSIPVGPVNTNDPSRTILPFISYISSVFDKINIMTYGMNGGWADWDSWHDGALYGETTSSPMTVDASFRAYRNANLSPSKLGLGIGFFGSCMRGVTGPKQKSPEMQIVGAETEMSYSSVISDYYHPNLARWDDKAKVPYLASSVPFGRLKCTYVTYENEKSIAAKADYFHLHQIGGVIIWNINEGYLASAPPGERDPLMDAIQREFLGPSRRGPS